MTELALVALTAWCLRLNLELREANRRLELHRLAIKNLKDMQ